MTFNNKTIEELHNLLVSKEISATELTQACLLYTSEMAFFQVSNIITTTGFGYGDITNWPLFSQYILLMLMAIGGSAGSRCV